MLRGWGGADQPRRVPHGLNVLAGPLGGGPATVADLEVRFECRRMIARQRGHAAAFSQFVAIDWAGDPESTSA